jgi:hypothetical protein
VAISVEAWNAARSRVLTRQADKAERDAEYQRQRAGRVPGGADPAEWAAVHHRIAAGLDRYAAECRAAAADPSLPTPTYAGSEVDARR